MGLSLSVVLGSCGGNPAAVTTGAEVFANDEDAPAMDMDECGSCGDPDSAATDGEQAGLDLQGEATSSGEDVGGHIDVPAPDLPDAATPPTPPAPYQATGQFIEVPGLFPNDWPLDLGNKATMEPASSGAVIDDIDGDQLPDLLVHDGVAHLWMFRSLAGQPWKWNKEPLAASGLLSPRTVALFSQPGAQPAVLACGTRLYYWTWQKAQGAWVEDAVERGLQVPFGIAVQSVQPADLDEDGLLDVIATIFTCDGKSKLLAFLSQGNGQFASAATGLGISFSGSIWNTLHTDIDADGHADLLVLTESCSPKPGNAYFHNRAHPDTGPRYEQRPLQPLFLAPKDFGGSPMGGAVADWNGDGQLDLFLAQIGLRDLRMAGTDLRKLTPADAAKYPYDGNQLLLGKGAGQFQPVAAQQGLTLALSATGQSMVAWTGLPVDLDADGRLDLMMSHGYDYGAFVLADEGGARPVFFRNQGNGNFVDLSATVALPEAQLGRGLSLSDLDNDGDEDLFLGGQGMVPRLMRNDLKTGGQALRVRLQGTASNPWGLGAHLTLQTTGRVLVAEHSVQAASQGMAAPLTRFAWPGGEAAVKLTIVWPSGYKQQLIAGGWPINGAPLTVTEPALLTLSSRWLPATAAATSVIKARSYDVFAKSIPAPQLDIELAPGQPGTFDGPTVCDQVECTRTFRPPVAQTGESAFLIGPPGQPWRVRPRVRYVQQPGG